MSYFNHTFRQVHVGTKATTANSNQTKGFITTAGIPTSSLAIKTGVAATDYGPGSWGLFNAKTYLSVSSTTVDDNACSLILASASLMSKDKLNPVMGGYKESVKSKEINPKYVKSFIRVDSCTPTQQVVHVGTTKYTKTLSPSNSGCSFSFVCGETYTLRIDVQGSPALRYLNHNGYRLFQADGGCCAADNPAAVIDGTLIMIQWANQLIADPLYKDFIYPIVYSEAGVALYPPGTEGQYTWDNYVSPGHTNGKYAGLRLLGAYVDTKFGNCSFQVTDFYEKEPIRMIVSMTDFNGDPCAFTGICAVTECNGLMGNGFGETAVRDLILSQAYMQNSFPTDIRMREIEQGNDILNALDRDALYSRYIITHVVPRYGNPSGLFDQDAYTVEIITDGTNSAFEATMAAWLSAVGDGCATLETISCTPCTPMTP